MDGAYHLIVIKKRSPISDEIGLFNVEIKI